MRFASAFQCPGCSCASVRVPIFARQHQRHGTQFGPSMTDNPGYHQKHCNLTNHPAPKLFSRRVLHLRLQRFETIHFEVFASEVGYLNILQDCVCARPNGPDTGVGTAEGSGLQGGIFCTGGQICGWNIKAK